MYMYVLQKPTMKNPVSRRPSVTQERLTSSDYSSSGTETEPDKPVYNSIANNPSTLSSTLSSRAPLSLSQSHQILTEAGSTNNVSPSSRVLFGIARRASSHSSPPVTPSHLETGSESSKETGKNTLISPRLSGGLRVDKSTELARWMGKSPVGNNLTDGGASLPLQTQTSVTNNELKIEPINKPQGQFNGLFTNLKRSSVDTAINGPLYKRVA